MADLGTITITAVASIPIGAVITAGVFIYKRGGQDANYVNKDWLASALKPYATTETVDLKIDAVKATVHGLSEKVDGLREDIQSVGKKTDQILTELIAQRNR